MIGGINAGLMILTPDKNVFEYMKAELAMRTKKPTFGPEQDYLSRFYNCWRRIPVEFNFQLHQLGYLSREFKSWEQPERRLEFEHIAIIHYSGKYSPHDWIFEDNNLQQFDSWVKTHLLPKYGKVDHVDMRTLELCINRWHKMWQRVRGQILADLCSSNTRDESIKRGMVACKPWVDEEMPLPKNAKMCENCWRWSLRMQNTTLEESSLDRKGRRKHTMSPCKKAAARAALCTSFIPRNPSANATTETQEEVYPSDSEACGEAC